jgi:filamentous hemagglutinin
MPGAAVKSFEVPQSFLTDLRNAAITRAEVRDHPESPISVDVTKAKDQFGLRPDQIEALRKTIIQKSGKVH